MTVMVCKDKIAEKHFRKMVKNVFPGDTALFTNTYTKAKIVLMIGFFTVLHNIPHGYQFFIVTEHIRAGAVSALQRVWNKVLFR